MVTTAKVKPKKGAVPTILPREPLTKKAFAAIFEYANHRADTKMQGYKMAYLMAKWVLEAERMRRVDLYAWLETRGFKWLPQHGFWEKKDKPPKPKAD